MAHTREPRRGVAPDATRPGRLASVVVRAALRGVLRLAVACAVFAAGAAAAAPEDGLYIYMRWPYLAYWKPMYDAAIAADYVDGASISIE